MALSLRGGQSIDAPPQSNKTQKIYKSSEGGINQRNKEIACNPSQNMCNAETSAITPHSEAILLTQGKTPGSIREPGMPVKSTNTT